MPDWGITLLYALLAMLTLLACLIIAGSIGYGAGGR